jgi:hypothetical protein
VVSKLDRNPNQQKQKKAGSKYPRNNYHPNSRGQGKKPVNTIPLYIMARCKKCGKALGNWTDSSEHFLKFIYDKGWKNVNFTKSEVNENPTAKDIRGICCPECWKDIGEWKKENHPNEDSEDDSGLYLKLNCEDGIRPVDTTPTAAREPFNPDLSSLPRLPIIDPE